MTGPIENVYLAFAKDWNIKRVVYSASFGTDKWEYSKEQTCLCKQLLKQFNGVSCREKNGVEMCKEKFDCTAEHVLDPTLLLEKDIYSNFFDCNNSLHYDEILYYILDWTDNKRKLLDYIIKKLAVNLLLLIQITKIRLLELKIEYNQGLSNGCRDFMMRSMLLLIVFMHVSFQLYLISHFGLF